MVKICGENKEGYENLTVTQMLEKEGYNGAYVAVELNEEILDRENFSSITINENDIIEVVQFMGGGTV